MTGYCYELDVELISTLEKLAKRDKRLYTAVQKKVLQVIENPYRGKPLKEKLKGKRRAHIGHFVLIYRINEREHKVIFLEFAHHDEAYK